jgi:hypothetical protein
MENMCRGRGRSACALDVFESLRNRAPISFRQVSSLPPHPPPPSRRPTDRHGRDSHPRYLGRRVTGSETRVGCGPENNAHLSKAVMLYTLTMTSDVSFFNATVRGLANKKQVAVARRRHGLQTMDGAMPVPRKPSEAEHEAIRGRLMSALGTVLEEHCVQTWLGAELGAAIAALKSSGASSLSPRQKEARRPMAGPPRTLGSFELVCSRDHWRLIHPSWSVSITMNHQFLSKPSDREQNQVHELLGRLLASHV